MINKTIDKLVSYGLLTGLIEECDVIYVRNKILTRLGVDSYEQTNEICSSISELSEILNNITDFAVEKGLIEDSLIYRDIFDTEIMDILTPYPSIVINTFKGKYETSPEEATDYFYGLSCDTNYIRRDRIKKDIKWNIDSEYGEIEITINCSKPEKDPKAIAAAKLQKLRCVGVMRCTDSIYIMFFH